ncbi:MAG: hypothetical protein R6X02_08205 [Enhygromyxa sp.]
MLSEIEPYVDPYHNCLYCASGNVLVWWGLEHRFIEQLFASELRFYYYRDRGDELEFSLVQDFVRDFVLDKAPLRERMTRLFKHFRIGVQWHESNDAEASWAEICEVLQVRPIVLFVDHFYIPHHELYQKDHGGHFLTLFDHRGGVCEVLDSVKRVYFRGKMDAEVLLRARLLDDPLLGTNNGWLDFEVGPESKRAFDREALFRACMRAVEEMVWRRPEGNRMWGLEGIRAFREDMARLARAAPSYELLIERAPRLDRSLRYLFVCLTRVSQQREALGQLLSSLRGLVSGLSGYHLQMAADAYAQLVTRWTIARNLVYIAVARRDLGRLCGLEQQLGAIEEAERDAIERLQEVASGIGWRDA